MPKRYAAILMSLVSLAICFSVLQWRSVVAQNNQTPTVVAQQSTATAAPVLLPSNTPTATELPPTPTRTPTSQGRPYIEAKNPDANVRSGPGTEYDRLGVIQPSEPYFVIGKFYKWYQIEYPNAPNGIAWVFEDVVSVFGDVNLIPNLAIEDAPTIDPAIAAQAETLLAATQTPGGLLTLTAEVQFTPQGIFTTTPEPTTTLLPGERLPTFTFPPFTDTPIPVEQLQARRVDIEATNEEPFAPAIPVLGLIGLGTLGLMLGIFRRIQ
ncbi:MAG: hypothetical protein CUN55_09595 [Phototrophicales bacterium]|nr:MAG: hypothetical protein CUN55_09595 [Phototrophicales bacterium]